MTHARNAPSAQRVARRALILAALVCRGNLDADARRARDVCARLRDWCHRLPLGDELGARERRVLEAPFGALTPEARLRAGWESEGLAVVAWALGRCELPRFDRKVDPFAVTDAVGLLADEVWLLDKPKLRPRAAIAALREVLYAGHVRLAQFARTRTPRNVAHYFEPEWFAASGVENDVLAKCGDLAIDGRRVAVAPEARWRDCLAVVQFRHRAIVWLAGEYPRYEDTPADT